MSEPGMLSRLLDDRSSDEMIFDLKTVVEGCFPLLLVFET